MGGSCLIHLQPSTPVKESVALSPLLSWPLQSRTDHRGEVRRLMSIWVNMLIIRFVVSVPVLVLSAFRHSRLWRCSAVSKFFSVRSARHKEHPLRGHGSCAPDQGDSCLLVRSARINRYAVW